MSGLLQQLITRQADRRPEATALIFDQEHVSYAQLEQISNQLARLLKTAGCQKDDRVCFLMPKSPVAIISMLGILKADCIYVPLDPASPAPRLSKVIESSEPRLIIAAGPVTRLLDDLLPDAPTHIAIGVGWMDTLPPEGLCSTVAFTRTDLARYSDEPLDYQHTSADAAHILFTSGSTGVPKGVIITHANVVHFVAWANKYFDMTADDRNSGHSPLHFDLSTFDVYGTLACGAQLHIVPPQLNMLPNKLADFIRASALTQWFSVPSILNYMAKFDVVAHNDFPSLKRLLWCGETFPTPPLMYWMKRLPHVTFTNLYGPTEATIASSYFTLPGCPENERAAIPIGTGCTGEELLVLDERLRPLPTGELGDLYIRGIGLSPGYWRDPDKTRAAFLHNPNSSALDDRIYKTGDLAKIGEDGLAYFHGRADFQIKSRGYRIELGEIETALHALDLFRECAVVAIETAGFESATICCAYVPALDVADVTPLVIRKQLSRAVPGYMLPARWAALDRLPKNASGKIDRHKLKEHFERNLEGSH